MNAIEVKDDSLEPALQELARIIDGAVGPDGTSSPFHKVWASRSTTTTLPSPAVYTPLLCVVARGTKRVLFGDEHFIYDARNFLINSVALPAAGQVIDASAENPCLWLSIELDPDMVKSVIVDAGLPNSSEGLLRAMEASPMNRPLLDAIVRLARLFKAPDDAEFLVPLAMREIIYWLLKSEQAPRLHQIAALGGQAHRAVRAIDWVRNNFSKPLTIEKLAKEVGMSPSALHHHFKEVTAMSPLQFQKQLRLQEAKRLMANQGLDAASAGIEVGYDDPSYFSREYRRFFGDPPRRHLERIRNHTI